MPVKHFVINPNKNPLSKESLDAIRREQELTLLDGDVGRFEKNKQLIEKEDELKYVEGRIVVKIDDKSKDSHTFANGTKIRIERRFNNFNRRQTDPINCHVISSSYIPAKSEILVNPNAIQESFRIFSYNDTNSDVAYYSFDETFCYAYYDGGEWKPLKNYDFALRVFEPYNGFILGVEPKQLKDYLYVITGKLKGNVVKTLDHCDYEIVFQNKDGKEGNIIRFMPFGDGKTKPEEAILIDHSLTNKVNKGKLLVGVSIKDAKPLNEQVPIA